MYVTIAQSEAGRPFAPRRFDRSAGQAVRRYADGSTCFGLSFVCGLSVPAPTVRFNRKQVRRQAVRQEQERRKQAEHNRQEQERKQAARFAVPALPADLRTCPTPETDTDRDRAAWRNRHGSEVVRARPAGRQWIKPAEFGGLEISAQNECRIVRVDCSCQSGTWDITAPVRRFFARRTRSTHADGSDPTPFLEFELISADENGAWIRVDGPGQEIARIFDRPELWPKWVRQVTYRDTVRVLVRALPSSSFGAWQDCHQSEVKRDRDARTPSGVGKRVKQALRYVRASQLRRQEIDPTGPRGLLG